MAEKDYTLEIEKKTPIDEKIEEKQVPTYFERLELNQEQKDRLTKEVFEEFDEIKEERASAVPGGGSLEDYWDALDNQYDGILQEDSRRQFNLNRKITKVKVNKVTNLIMQALMESDPKFSISPRPEFARGIGQEICDKQSDFIDDRLDNLPFREPMGQVVHSATLKGTGFLKVTHVIKREPKKREERYKGDPQPVMQNGKIVTGPDNKPLIRNKGLEEFLRNWPNAMTDYPGLVQKLVEGKEITIVAKYTETTYNDPEYKNVDLKNFFARISTEGYEGLKTTKLTVERQSFSWWDLKREERKEFFYDIDELVWEDKEKTKQLKDHKSQYYDILECVYYGKLDDTDEDGEEVKMVLYIAEEKKVIIGSIMYPYYGVDCYYEPHYISKKKAGLYGDSMGADLTDSDIAENAILNFILEGAYISNMITPITPLDSEIDIQFSEKRWTHGIPLNAKPNEVDFLQAHMKPMDIGGMLNLLQYVMKGDDDVTGVSSLMSGRTDPLDPTAPASKTVALLQQSGIDIKAYILTIAPCFNLTGTNTLQLYYQMSKEGRKYRPNPERVVGSDPFAEISRAEMIAKTNIQTQAYAFDFDKLNQKKEDFALLGTIRQEPLIAKNPEAVYLILKRVIKNWSPSWSNQVDKILPPLQDFKKQQVQVAVQAVAMYVKMELEKAKTTGAAPQFNPMDLLALVNDMRAESVTPPPPEVIKARQKGPNA